MKLWLVNGISRSGNELGGVGMTAMAVTEAEAIGLVHLEMARQSPEKEVVRLWATDISGTARLFVKVHPE